MDAQELLSDLHSRGFTLVPNGEKIAISPADRLADHDRVALRAYKRDLLRILTGIPAVPVAVEVIYVEPGPRVAPVSPEFPPCRKCGARRFWIADSGKVVCGGRGCGEVNYILASISFHPIT